jgi:hypothetical protein
MSCNLIVASYEERPDDEMAFDFFWFTVVKLQHPKGGLQHTTVTVRCRGNIEHCAQHDRWNRTFVS